MTRKEINALIKQGHKPLKNGVDMDKYMWEFMKGLELPRFRSLGSRYKDRKKAIEKYGKMVDMSLFEVHHGLDGLVGIIPKSHHAHIYHYGYFYRLSH